MARSHHFTPSPGLNSFCAASVMCCSAPPPASSTPLRPSVCYSGIGPVGNILCIRTCDHRNALIFCTRLTSFRRRAGTLRREYHASFERPSLPSPALPSFLLPSFPPSSYLPRFLFPPLPHFLRPASLPPCFSSILHVPFPPRWFGSICKACSSYEYVIFILI